MNNFWHHSLLEEQTKSVISSLQKEAAMFYAKTQERRAARLFIQEKVIGILRTTIQSLWSFADIIPFGSHATGLSSTSRLFLTISYATL